MRTVFAGALLLAGCHAAQQSLPPPLPPPEPPAVTVVPDSVTRPPRRVRSDTALSAAEREAIVREAQTRRAAWRALGIQDYSIRVTVGCFCPWPQTPVVLDVRGGVAVGALREPWSKYTVEGLFDRVEEGARSYDVLEVTYNARYGYPTYISGDAVLGRVDDWFWVRATELTPRP